jgi:orotate phosphoribosyltransferase
MTTTRSAAEIAAANVVAGRTEELFRRSGALREGHFLLKSGKHSERYLEKFMVLQDPAATSEL